MLFSTASCFAAVAAKAPRKVLGSSRAGGAGPSCASPGNPGKRATWCDECSFNKMRRTKSLKCHVQSPKIRIDCDFLVSCACVIWWARKAKFTDKGHIRLFPLL